jgi:hypothetical protein
MLYKLKNLYWHYGRGHVRKIKCRPEINLPKEENKKSTVWQKGQRHKHTTQKPRENSIHAWGENHPQGNRQHA